MNRVLCGARETMNFSSQGNLQGGADGAVAAFEFRNLAAFETKV
jgi:hypothetical protein